MAETALSQKKLAAALLEAGAPGEMVAKALANHYHDFLSPLAMPEMALVEEARAQGLTSIVEGVLEGRWDATKEESDAWAASPDGQETFRKLVSGE